jgi:hypothetical protein
MSIINYIKNDVLYEKKSYTVNEREAALIAIKKNTCVTIINEPERQSNIVLFTRDLIKENIIDSVIILNITTKPDNDIKKDIQRFFYNYENRKNKNVYSIDVNKTNRGKRSNIFDCFIYLNDKELSNKLKFIILERLKEHPVDILMCRIQKNIPKEYYSFLKDLNIPCIISH